MTEPVLRVEGLTLRFGGVAAVHDVSFDVHAGELFAVIGPNGSGKTSILNCLNGVYHPQAGSMLLDGRELRGLRPAATVEAGIARTFQNLGLFANLNVFDNLMLGRHHLMRTGPLAGALWFGKARREEIEHRRRCAELIELLELIPYRYLPVGMLPYGLQKRVELGRALVMEPKVLLLDEPVAGTNLEETEDMARYLLSVRDRMGFAIVLVEHHLDLVMDLADRVLVLDFGEVVTIGSPDEVRRNRRVESVYLGTVDGDDGVTAAGGGANR